MSLPLGINALDRRQVARSYTDVALRHMPPRRRRFLLTLLWLLLPVVAAPKERPPDIQDVAHRILVQTNELRRKEGRQKIRSNDKLTEAAVEFARFLSRSDKFGHGADGRRPEERATQHGYDYCIVSENLGSQFSTEGFRAEELALKFLQGWEQSPGHRRNLLDPDVTEIGVAVAHNEHSGHYYAVQMFGRPQSDAIAFKLANNTAATIAYALGGESLSLPPGSIGTHRQCGAVELTFRWPDNQRPTTVTPTNGDYYTIVREGSAKYRLNKK